MSGIDAAGVNQYSKTGHGKTSSQCPLTHTGPVAHIDEVTHGTHRAEVSALGNCTKAYANAQGQPQQLKVECREFWCLHGNKL